MFIHDLGENDIIKTHFIRKEGLWNYFMEAV